MTIDPIDRYTEILNGLKDNKMKDQNDIRAFFALLTEEESEVIKEELIEQGIVTTEGSWDNEIEIQEGYKGLEFEIGTILEYDPQNHFVYCYDCGQKCHARGENNMFANYVNHFIRNHLEDSLYDLAEE